MSIVEAVLLWRFECLLGVADLAILITARPTCQAMFFSLAASLATAVEWPKPEAVALRRASGKDRVCQSCAKLLQENSLLNQFRCREYATFALSLSHHSASCHAYCRGSAFLLAPEPKIVSEPRALLNGSKMTEPARACRIEQQPALQCLQKNLHDARIGACLAHPASSSSGRRFESSPPAATTTAIFVRAHQRTLEAVQG